MVTAIPLKNIEEEQKVDRATAAQIAKIMRFLRNIEDWQTFFQLNDVAAILTLIETYYVKKA